MTAWNNTKRIVTRWSASYDMLNALIQLRYAMSKYVLQHSGEIGDDTVDKIYSEDAQTARYAPYITGWARIAGTCVTPSEIRQEFHLLRLAANDSARLHEWEALPPVERIAIDSNYARRNQLKARICKYFEGKRSSPFPGRGARFFKKAAPVQGLKRHRGRPRKQE